MEATLIEVVGAILIIFAPAFSSSACYGKSAGTYCFWIGFICLGLSMAFSKLYIGAFIMIFIGIFNVMMAINDK